MARQLQKAFEEVIESRDTASNSRSNVNITPLFHLFPLQSSSFDMLVAAVSLMLDGHNHRHM